MRRALSLITSLLLAAPAIHAGAGALDAGVPETFPDGKPLCGVEGDGPLASLPAGSSPVIGTYNVLHSQGEEAPGTVGERLPQIVAAMAEAGADAWGLQEVTRNSQYGVVAQQIAAGLADTTGEAWAWCWSWSNPHVPGEPDVYEGGGGPLSEQMAQFSNFPADGDFREGLAAVSRLPIVDARFRRLPPRHHEAALCVPPDPIGCNLTAFFDSRQLLHTAIDAGPEAGEFDLFTTHLAHGLTPASDTSKRVQLEAALLYIDEWRDAATPDFFTGDYNSEPGSDRHQAVLGAGFADTFGAANPGADGFTSSQDVVTNDDQATVSSRIDYVFARGCSAVTSEVIGDSPEPIDDGQWRWPSDHFGVASTLSCTSGT